jgi:hypothetical protein
MVKEIEIFFCRFLIQVIENGILKEKRGRGACDQSGRNFAGN